MQDVDLWSSSSDLESEPSDSSDGDDNEWSPALVPASPHTKTIEKEDHAVDWAGILRNVRDPAARMWSALATRPAACEAACAYLRRKVDGKPHKGTANVRNLALDMVHALQPPCEPPSPLPVSVWDLDADDLATLLANLADAQRKQRARLHARTRAIAIGRMFDGWPIPDHLQRPLAAGAAESQALYLVVTSKAPQEITALFAVRFDSDGGESSRLVAKIHFYKRSADRASGVDVDAVGPGLRPYADLVPTLLCDLFVRWNTMVVHRIGDRRRGPPGVIVDAIARCLSPTHPVRLPPQVYAALWPAYDATHKYEDWRHDKQEVATVWLTEAQLAAALGAIAAYEAAQTVGANAPRYGRTDPLGAKSLRGHRPPADVGMLRSDGTGPLSLLQTAQVRIVESSWRVPLVDLPDDVAAPLAVAIWQRACTSRRAKDGTVDDAARLLDVARYWGVQPTEAQERRPEWLCQHLMPTALARSASMGAGQAVRVAWEATDRPPFPSDKEKGQWFHINVVGAHDQRLQFARATPIEMRAHTESAFASIYGRLHGPGDGPLVGKATDLAMRANALGALFEDEGNVCASHQAMIALGVVRGGLDVDPHVLSDPYTATDVFNGIKPQQSEPPVYTFCRYRPPSVVDGDDVDDDCDLEDSSEPSTPFWSTLEFL
ncbi:hypothetical protein psal_cds_820 [Pandoravirus salinus]|uniref:Uncharacterized protein n=1 Tax=Pandoravirus salinus TaxID=1349410 RepID=S4VW26_9VIRU|nr:hypothetical protein psal_cds_820 [Pandoravirus salinus]AGO84854.1 hypothetical protein psal_cds_820 [Pandoravirus salinus]